MITNNKPSVKHDVPLYFLEEYPVFIEFMDTFFHWLYNQQGFTEQEIRDYIANAGDWVNPHTTDSPLQQLIEIKSRKMQGVASTNFLEDHFLERKFEEMISLDETILDVEGRELFGIYDHNQGINAKYDDMGLERITDKPFFEYGEFFTSDKETFSTKEGDDLYVNNGTQKRRVLDHIRWLKLLKSIYRIRGTKKSFELFFWLYFGLPVQIKEPKNDIAGLDGNFDLDGVVGLRDDYYYDEYSYVIQIPVDDLKDYQGVFERIFKKHFHPAGFNVFLESSRR